MTKSNENLAAMLVRGRNNLAMLERAAAWPSATPDRKRKLGQVILMQADLNKRIGKALMARGWDPNLFG